MADRAAGSTKRTSRFYDLLMLALSVWVLVQLAIETLLKMPPSTQAALSYVDLAICIVFIADWVYFFVRATDKLGYLKTRAVDLVSSIPFVSFLRPLRVFRVIRIFRAFRLLRGLRGVSVILKTLSANPTRSALSIYLLATSLVYFYCSLGLYSFEKGVNTMVASYGDVLWMAFTTMTTVGYGDVYPITPGGRLISAILVITGMGLFSLLTAGIATFLLERIRKAREGARAAPNR